MREFENFTECYLSLADELINDSEFDVSPRGMRVKEKLAVSFKIKDPRNRLPHIPARKFSVPYFVGEMIWYLTGENSTDWISKYSSFWRGISDDGVTANSAYGARIFNRYHKIAGGNLIQWDHVKSILKKDPDSRRAVIHIKDPWDSVDSKLDVPCTLTLQFFIRDNKLHLVVNMRSSDLVFGLSYDVPAFTIMQELMAIELGVELGEYMHVSNSLHVYERHFGMLEKMVKEDQVKAALSRLGDRGPMPSITDLPDTTALHFYERRIQECDDSCSMRKIIAEAESNMSDFWIDMLKIVAFHRCKTIDLLEDAKSIRSSVSYVGYA